MSYLLWLRCPYCAQVIDAQFEHGEGAWVLIKAHVGYCCTGDDCGATWGLEGEPIGPPCSSPYVDLREDPPQGDPA